MEIILAAIIVYSILKRLERIRYRKHTNDIGIRYLDILADVDSKYILCIGLTIQLVATTCSLAVVKFICEWSKGIGMSFASTLAVNHDLMWNWDKAQAFNPANVDANRYATDPRYARHVDDLMKMQNGGVFQADHFVNVSNAVYDKNRALTHFIVSDTGNGTTRMIEKDYLYRAYNGGGRISVAAQGCVIAGRR